MPALPDRRADGVADLGSENRAQKREPAIGKYGPGQWTGVIESKPDQDTGTGAVLHCLAAVSTLTKPAGMRWKHRQRAGFAALRKGLRRESASRCRPFGTHGEMTI